MTHTNRMLLGFDFGKKSIGVAVGQEITGTASPLPALAARDGIPDWSQIEVIYQEWQPQLVIVGLPLNMDGTDQTMTHAARKFGHRLHNKFKITVNFYDERLTTADAKTRLFELGGYKKLKKDKIDSVSACLIIEGWMDAQY